MLEVCGGGCLHDALYAERGCPLPLDARIALRFRADAAIPATGMRLRLDAPAAGEIARLDYPIAAGVPAGERTIIVAMGIPGTASGRALVSVEFDGVSGRYVAPVSIA